MSPEDPTATMAAMYDESAPAYEKHWAPALHRHTRELLAAVPPADRVRRTVVDAATGTGKLVPDLTMLAGPDGQVLALDRSIGMLRRAGTDVTRIQSDAMALPLRDSVVDVLVHAFVLFLLPDAARAVREAARVLRPRGWLLAATWGEQRPTRADELVRETLQCAGAPEPAGLVRSDEATNSPEAMADLLEAAGLERVVTRRRVLDAQFKAEAFVEMRTRCGVTAWRLAQLDPAARTMVTAKLADRVSALPADELVDRSEILLTAARMP